MSKTRKVIIAGGGTGGHIFPAIAIANALKKKDESIELLFVGAKGRMEMEKVPQAGFRIRGLDIAGFNRSSLIKNLGLPFKLVKSFLQVRRIFADFRPDAVVGVGGYSSFPVLRYAQAKGIPSFIHESNSFAGKSNILLGKKATQVFVAADGMEKFFPASKLLITGNPVRAAIAKVNEVNRGEALRRFNLDPAKQTVLIIGGSLGSRTINEALESAWKQVVDSGWQIIWQTGKTESGKWKKAVAKHPAVWIDEFITEMQWAYAAADVVISRAGAMAIAELCVVKKPVLFVPYPFAAEDHQTANAKNLQQKNAAVMVKDEAAKNELVPHLLQLMQDEQKQNELKQNISKLAVINADSIIADEILNKI